MCDWELVRLVCWVTLKCIVIVYSDVVLETLIDWYG